MSARGDKYECNGQYFTYWCDANECSWQLCRAYIDGLEDPDQYRVRKWDNLSYGVLQRSPQEFVEIFVVTVLT